MKAFLHIATIAAFAMTALSLTACSEDKSTAGIEIGNPSLADSDSAAKQSALPLVAEFTVDYSEAATQQALTKSTSKSEPFLLDTFALTLTEIRSFSSYYTSISVDPVLGLQLWPYENDPDAELKISFTEGTAIEEPFKDIDLQEEGYLKEMGVGFHSDENSAIYGRVKIGKKYHRFVYSLSNFQNMMLRYHYSQIDTGDGKANLSVIFRVKTFTNGIDFSNAEIAEDSVVYINSKFNAELWATLNERFIPSFQPLRFDYTTATEETISGYVEDIWNDIAAKKGENTIINGNFQSPFTTDWILMNQFGGHADTTLIDEKGKERIMKVEVTKGGTHSYSIQLIQENVALIKDVKYKCVFTIWSDIEDSITVRIGSYSTYETVGFQKHVNVQTTGHSVEIDFSPTVSDPFARFELNLGGAERTFWLKEVQVLRLE